MLLAGACKQVGIPRKLLRCVGRNLGCATVKSVEERQHARPAEPGAGVVEVAPTSMLHAMPISDEIIRRILEKLMASVQIIEGVEQASPNDRKSFLCPNFTPSKSRII